jgi:hypothetical protein
VLRVEQSTLAQNTADLGGAIYNVGELNLGNSTAVDAGAGIENVGGTISARNTILAGNTVAGGSLSTAKFPRQRGEYLRRRND